MKSRDIKFILITTFCCILLSCYKDNSILQTTGMRGIYITESTGGQIIDKKISFTKINEDITLPISVSLGMNEVLNEDIEVEISYDSTLLYKRLSNEKEFTYLSRKNIISMPSKVVIKAGQKTSNIEFIKAKYTNDLTTNHPYYLPIKIKVATNSSNIQTSYTQDVIFYRLSIFTEPIDKSNWKILDFSSEEDIEEGSDNGRAVFAIDNNNSTFWITLWGAAKPSPPHHISIDLGKEEEMLGLILNVKNNTWDTGKPKDAVFHTSQDGITWDEGEKINDIPNIQTDIYIPFTSPKKARYIRLKVNTTHADTYWLFINEIGIY